MVEEKKGGSARRSRRQNTGIWLGPVLAIALQFLPLPNLLLDQAGDIASARSAWIVLSLLILMAVWWISEAVPIPVTSLLPLVVLPLAGVLSIRNVSGEYAHPVVVLLMGGFIIAKAVERWNLHTRIALIVVARAGYHPSMIVAGFMLAAALLSMWISNTATSMMMMPIALSVAGSVFAAGPQRSAFTYALLLGIAWSCSIGGLGTPVGTPTNLIVIGYLNETAGFQISFSQWMMLGVPAVILMVPAAWVVLTRWAFPLGKLKVESGSAAGGEIRTRLAALGPMSVPETRTLVVFALVACLWVFRGPLTGLTIMGAAPLAGMTDHLIAIFGVIILFLIPSGDASQPAERLLDWPTAESIPWGVLLLFGGGMALASAITATGLGGWIGAELGGLSAFPTLVVMLVLTTLVIFATEVTSNVATAASLMPVIGAVALSTGLPVELLAAPLALAASCAFMLPLATGPNAVVFATGEISLPTMAGAGIRLNLIAIPLITAIVYLIAPSALG